MRRKLALLILAFTVLVPYANGIGLLKGVAAAEEISDSLNILKDVDLTVLDAQNNPVTLGLVEQGANVRLDYKYELPNGHGYRDGDTFTFSLPASFELFNDINSPLLIDDEDVGEFTVNRATHQVVMTFYSYITDHDDVSGTLTLNTKFDKKVLTGSSLQEIQIPISTGPKTFPIRFRPNVASTIDKSGVPQGFNAKSIAWTIDANKKLDSVTNASVTDPIPAGLSLQNSSITVYSLDVNLDGSVTVGSPVDASEYTIGQTDNGKDFKLTFQSPIDSAYRIEYVTDITDGTAESFVNEATLQGDDLSPVKAAATVSVTRGTPLEKSSTGYDSLTQTIDWEIKYNYDEQNILSADSLLEDRYNDIQELVAGSLKVYPVALDSNGNETLGAALTPGTDYQLTPVTGDIGKNGFDLQFLSDVGSAMKVAYKTQATAPVYDDATIVNAVNETATASRRIEQVVLRKSSQNPDYANKTVDWTLRLNGNRFAMQDVLLTDTFSNGGLEFLPGTLVVRKEDGSVLDASEYTVDASEPKEGFSIDFANDVLESYSVTYTTNFNNDWLTGGASNFDNNGKLEWKESGVSMTAKTTTGSFYPNDYTKNNGYKFGSYNATAKELSWSVGVNYNLKTLQEPEMVDPLLLGQELIPGSVQIHELSIDADGTPVEGGLVDESEYAVSVKNGALSVKYNHPIGTAYLISFRTTIEGELIDTNIDNAAELKDGSSTVSKELKATVAIPRAGEYVFKNGQQNGDKVDWTVYVNRGQSYVKNAKLVDHPTDNQLLLENTFHLYSTTVAADGSITKSAELTKGTDYALAISTDADGVQSFELSFKNDIKSAYILEYQSLIVAGNGDTVGNSISFSGNNVQSVSKDTDKEIIVGVSSGAGTGSGVRGELTVTKVNAAGNAKLPGAVFVLYRVTDADPILINTLTTDADGVVVFKKLLAGDYLLKETVAPRGYQLDGTEYPVTISSANKLVSLEISNKRNPTSPSVPTDPATDPDDGTDPGDTGGAIETPGGTTDPTDPTDPAGTTEGSTDPKGPTDSNSSGPSASEPAGTADHATDNNSNGEEQVAGAGVGPSGNGPAKTLPKTGEASPLPIELAGLALIALGAGWLFLLRHGKQ